MKCQHCGSNDIVTIQGQQFCLNCGYKVDIATPPTPSKPTPPVVGKMETPVKRVKKAPKKAPDAPAVATKTTRSTFAATPAAPSPHPLRFSLESSSIVGALAGITVAVALWFRVENDIALYLLVIGGISVGVAALLAQSALTFGVSRFQDRRPVAHSVWWAAARAGSMDMINLGLIATLLMAVVIGIGVLAWKALTQSMELSQPIEALVLVLINILLGWALLGVYTARRLGAPAVIIGGTTAWQGFCTGWKMYRKAGGHLMAAIIEVVLARLTVIGSLAVITYAAVTLNPGLSDEMRAVAAGFAAAILVMAGAFSLMEIEARVWLRQYRHWVGILETKERVKLLTGRAAPRI